MLVKTFLLIPGDADTCHGWGKDTELGRATVTSHEAILTLHVSHGSFSSLVSWPKQSSNDRCVLFYKFYFQVKKENLWGEVLGINRGRNICLWNAGG